MHPISRTSALLLLAANVLTCGLQACSGAASDPTTASYYAESQTEAAPVPAAPLRPIVPTRGFLTHRATPSRTYYAFGYVLLTEQPGEDTLKLRYLAACRAFLGTDQPTDRSGGYYPGSRLMPTFWLLAATPSDARCDDLILQYDYARAADMLGEIARFSVRGAVQGPVLVAWHAAPGGTAATRELLLDLSNLSNEDMQRALAIWMQDVARDPQLWQARFDAAAIRERLLNLIQKYGDEIMQML